MKGKKGNHNGNSTTNGAFQMQDYLAQFAATFQQFNQIAYGNTVQQSSVFQPQQNLFSNGFSNGVGNFQERSRGKKSNKKPNGLEAFDLQINNYIDAANRNVLGMNGSSAATATLNGPNGLVSNSKPHLLELQITIEENLQRFKVYFNRNVHKTLDQYIDYLSQSLQVSDPSSLVLKIDKYPYDQITDVFQIQHGLELLLSRKDSSLNQISNLKQDIIGDQHKGLNLGTGGQNKRDSKYESKRLSRLEKQEGEDDIVMSQSNSYVSQENIEAMNNLDQMKEEKELKDEETVNAPIDKEAQKQSLLDLMQKVQQFNQAASGIVPNQAQPKRNSNSIYEQLVNMKTNSKNVSENSINKTQNSQNSKSVSQGTMSLNMAKQRVYPDCYHRPLPFIITRVPKRFIPLSVHVVDQSSSQHIVLDDEQCKDSKIISLDTHEDVIIEESNSIEQVESTINNPQEEVSIISKQQTSTGENGSISREYLDIQAQIRTLLNTGPGVANNDKKNQPQSSINKIGQIKTKESSSIFNTMGKSGSKLEGSTPYRNFEDECSIITQKRGRGRPVQQRSTFLRPQPKERFEQYPLKLMSAKNEAEYDAVYTRTVKLNGFEPWQDWVPMPYPHRELSIARQMYTKGDKLLVATPDFVDFANELSNVISRNQLIYRCKRMMMERGMRSCIQFSGTGETRGIQVVILCTRSGKAPSSAKNPSIKNSCPFAIHFIRKSLLKDKEIVDELTSNIQFASRLKRKEITLTEQQTEAFDNEEFVFRKPAKQLKGNEDDTQYFEFSNLDFRSQNPDAFNIVNMNQVSLGTDCYNEDVQTQSNQQEKQNYPMNELHKMLEDIVIEDDPFFLQKYRAFHNHEIDTNMITFESLVPEKDVFRRGAEKALPQGLVAIQEYSGQRRREINEEKAKRENRTITFEECKRMHESMLRRNNEGLEQSLYTNDEDEFEGCEFEQMEKTTTIYKVDPGDPEFDQICQIRIIEPIGMTPAFIVVDMTNEDDEEVTIQTSSQQDQRRSSSGSKWPPLKSQINHCRDLVMECYYKILDQVMQRFDSGVYNLDKYRRVFQSRMMRKAHNFLPQQTDTQANAKKRGRKQKSNADQGSNNIQKLMEQQIQKNQLDDLVNSDDEQYNAQNRLFTQNNNEDETEDNNYSIYD